MGGQSWNWVRHISNIFGCGCYFVAECSGWMKVLCWIDHGIPKSKECGCWACDPSVHLDAPSIGFVYVFVCRKLSPHL